MPLLTDVDITKRKALRLVQVRQTMTKTNVYYPIPSSESVVELTDFNQTRQSELKGILRQKIGINCIPQREELIRLINEKVGKRKYIGAYIKVGLVNGGLIFRIKVKGTGIARDKQRDVLLIAEVDDFKSNMTHKPKVEALAKKAKQLISKLEQERFPQLCNYHDRLDHFLFIYNNLENRGFDTGDWEFTSIVCRELDTIEALINSTSDKAKAAIQLRKNINNCLTDIVGLYKTYRSDREVLNSRIAVGLNGGHSRDVTVLTVLNELKSAFTELNKKYARIDRSLLAGLEEDRETVSRLYKEIRDTERGIDNVQYGDSRSIQTNILSCLEKAKELSFFPQVRDAEDQSIAEQLESYIGEIKELQKKYPEIRHKRDYPDIETDADRLYIIKRSIKKTANELGADLGVW